jgi:hypothetical protein
MPARPTVRSRRTPSTPTPPRRSRRGGAVRLAVSTALAALAVATQGALAGAATAVSSNWSGYAVTGTTFASVSGSWVQPAASCGATTGVTASAFWVGLGGDSSSSSALEQTGTEADCLAGGGVRYSAWYELVPAASVKVALAVDAGDRMSGSVRVSGTAVTIEVRNLTTGAAFAKTLERPSPDVSSAEWIAEAPSTAAPGRTAVLPLTDFGAVAFSGAAATASDGHTGAISDRAWTATGIVLRSSGRGGPAPFGPFASNEAALSEAVPSGLRARGTAFTVTWRGEGQRGAAG